MASDVFTVFMGELATAVSSLDNLYSAWRDVRSHVAHTAWPHITSEMQEIDASPLRVLFDLQSALRGQTFQFSPKHGYTKRKSGGSRRGIAIHSVRDRIVQRAILNVLYSGDPRLQKHLGSIPAVLNRPRSFAGMPGRGVPEAIAAVVQLIRDGARAYVYSDMKDFFPCIPREDVVGFIASNANDPAFVRLFERGLETELENEEALGELRSLFPGPEVGVAQGSLLSVLAGNIVMRHFDDLLNTNELAMIRYLDDFVILARDVAMAERAFERAQRELARIGMTCYAPGDGSQKAFLGCVAEGFDFLGCRIHPDGISPSSRNRRKFLRQIKGILADAKREIRLFKDDGARRRAEQAYIQTLQSIDRKLRGWGDAYQFVTNRVTFSQMDRAVDELLYDFQCWFERLTRDADLRPRRRMMGIALLADTPVRRIVAGEEIKRQKANIKRQK
jgi:hypothetical protein